MKTTSTFPRGSSAFTLVELLVSVSVLSLIMVVLVGMTNQISQTWRATTGKIEQFQEARDGFESMTRRLTQATLNTFWDLHYEQRGGRDVPTEYIRQSQLRFVSGPMANLAPKPNRPTHGVFFQAPLGFVESGSNSWSGTDVMKNLGSMDNLLNTWGYFVEVDDDRQTMPPFMDGKVPVRWRSRLMEFMQPSEEMSVYKLNTEKNREAPDESIRNQWFETAVNANKRPVRVLAENIVALIILPKLSKQDEDGLQGNPVLSPKFSYDSALTANEGNSPDVAATNPKNQLPPILQVTMIAIDEASASRHSDRVKNAPDFGIETSKLFKDSTRLEGVSGDLQKLESQLVEEKLTYRIFTTNVSIRGAKWSTQQTK